MRCWLHCNWIKFTTSAMIWRSLASAWFWHRNMTWIEISETACASVVFDGSIFPICCLCQGDINCQLFIIKFLYDKHCYSFVSFSIVYGVSGAMFGQDWLLSKPIRLHVRLVLYIRVVLMYQYILACYYSVCETNTESYSSWYQRFINSFVSDQMTRMFRFQPMYSGLENAYFDLPSGWMFMAASLFGNCIICIVQTFLLSYPKTPLWTN